MNERHFYRGRGMPLQRNNIDTDQIMPARFCYKPTRRGHENSVFGDWRLDSNFVLNNPNYQRASILVTGREFATGSSREFAVWGLKDWGFKVVIAPSFGDIFYKNAAINDLLPVVLEEKDVEALWALLLEDHYTEISIDLNKELVVAKDECFRIHISPITKRRYIDNLDEIKESLSLVSQIKQYEMEMEK